VQQQPAQQPTGDYGYDLVHEESAPARPVDPAHQAAPPPAPVPRPVELDGDYGYDEAHDL
jgi:hypothetical protein